ncbi:MAG TPA: hypothetical protein VIX17_18035 [Pyrinomonadaceae bacterium]
MDRKSKKPDPSSTYYNIHVHGHNYGNIQQGGKGNSQSLSLAHRTDNENK